MSNWSPKAPAWPAFLCEDGWAWHPRESKRHCHQTAINAPAELVGKFYKGPAVERILALRTLLLSGPQQLILKLLIPDCETCGTNPVRVMQLRGIWRRAAFSIHDGAIDDVRAASPDLHSFWHVNVASSRKHKPQYARLFARGIPVRDPTWDRRRPPQGEETRIAQVWWASKIIAAREERVA